MGHPAIDFCFDSSSPHSNVPSVWLEALAARLGRTVHPTMICRGATLQARKLMRLAALDELAQQFGSAAGQAEDAWSGARRKLRLKPANDTANAARFETTTPGGLRCRPPRGGQSSRGGPVMTEAGDTR